VAKRVHVTRDVVFNERAQWDWSTSAEQEAEASDDTFRVEMDYTTTVHDALGAQIMPGSPGPASPARFVSKLQSPVHDVVEEAGDQGVEFATATGKHVIFLGVFKFLGTEEYNTDIFLGP
jgi:hypothetical protein